MLKGIKYIGRITLGLILPQLLLAQQSLDSLDLLYDLSEIVVTAQYAPTDSRNAIHEIRTISGSEIQVRASNNLEQLLSQDASIRISQDPILGSSINLSGVDGQGVKIMIDGVPVIGRQNGNIDLSQINLANIQRVEIVEGPLGVRYGSDALGGVINLITRKSQLNRLNIGFQSLIESRGENSYQANLGIQLIPDLLLQVNGGRDEFSGWSDDTLRSVIWNPKIQEYGSASLAWNMAKDQQLRYSINFFEEQVENLGALRRPQFQPYAFDDYFLTTRIDQRLDYSGTMGESYYLNITAAYNQFKRQKRSVRFDFEEESEEMLEGQQDTSLFNGLQLQATLASQFTDSKINFQIGLDLRRDEASGIRILDTLSTKEGFSQIADYALFGSATYRPFAKTSIQAGLRYAYNSRYNAPLIPSVNIRQKLHSNWTARASFAKGFRSPDLKELFFNFIDINHYIVGNQELRAERSTNFQASLQYEKEENGQSTRLTLRGFYNNIQDRIGLYEYIQSDGEIIPAQDTSTLEFSYFNQEVYKTQGLSGSFEKRFIDFKAKLGVSLIGYFNPDHSSFADIDPFSYAIELASEFRYQIGSKGPECALFIRNTDKLISFFPTQSEDGEPLIGQRIQDGYSMIDLSIQQSILDKRISLTGGIRNILNVQQTNVSSSEGGIHNGSTGSALVGLGRSYFISAKVNLGWWSR